jgi:hypothetical protein
MLRQSCRSANLKALFSYFESEHLPSTLRELKPLMTSLGLASQVSSALERLDEDSTKPKARGKSKNLPHHLYQQLLALVQRLDGDLALWHDIYAFPHSQDQHILFDSYQDVRSILWKGHHHTEHRFSDFNRHAGNSFVCFSSLRLKARSYGKIQQIFDHRREVSGELRVQTFAAMSPFKDLSRADAVKSPLFEQDFPYLPLLRYSEEEQIELVPMENIHGHISVQYLPAGTFDIRSPVVAIVPLTGLAAIA